MVVFACQRDSFLKEFSTTVVSCMPVPTYVVDPNGDKKCYEVICEDTILFPEGGGQPYDLGALNDVPVLKVLRRGAEAVHYVEKPFDKGASVLQTLDWPRRLDHMQQHSGQHLLTAFADMMFGYATTSWWLGEEVSHIELDTRNLTQIEVYQLEDAVNQKIREALPVTAQVLQDGDSGFDATHLPNDHVGEVRIVTIATVGANLCCGTHVSNLSQLQAIKLLGFEKGKMGKTNLQFLVGGRVLGRMDKMYKRELQINLLLSNGPDSHAMLVDKLIKSNKAAGKNLQNTLKALASLEISKFKSLNPKPKFFHYYQKDVEIDYFFHFIREFKDPEVLLFLAIGSEMEGRVVLVGPDDLVTYCGPKVAKLLDGKGTGHGGRFQAKVKNLKALPAAVQLCQDACSQLAA